MMMNKYSSDTPCQRKDPSRQQNTKGKANPEIINAGFQKRFSDLESIFTNCKENEDMTYKYVIVMAESYFDDYVRRIVAYRLGILFHSPDLRDNSTQFRFADRFKISMVDVAENLSHLDDSIGKIIRRELQFVTLQKYNTLSEYCEKVGINADAFSDQEYNIKDIFDLRSKIVHHASKDDNLDIKISSDDVRKTINTIRTVQASIQKQVEELDKSANVE